MVLEKFSWMAAALVVMVSFFLQLSQAANDREDLLEVGFGQADITPPLGGKPVYMAGFGQNRKATAVHDPLMARTLVLRHRGKKIALASVDLVGFFRANVVRVRRQLPEFAYVLVSSTHDHEGPDSLGLWGPNPFTSGVDANYMQSVESKIAKAVQAADMNAQPGYARIGMARAAELLHDGREPYIKHDELVIIDFKDPKSKKTIGIVLQWNCHPETLGSKNTHISADFVGYTVREIQERYHCPVLYLTGTVGGLMTSLNVDIKDEQGKSLADGTFAKTERYGRLVGKLGFRALESAKQVTLTPLDARSREVFVPLYNKMFHVGRQLGILKRPAFVWDGDPYHAEPTDQKGDKKQLALATEVAWLRFGDLQIGAIPGEIYPELVLDRVQNPPDPGADFPDAPIEPAIYKQMQSHYRMMIGLANDEIGYIIPKRQWDEKPPFCYGRKRAQYGEVNSVGPETAPLICNAFRDLVKSANQKSD